MVLIPDVILLEAAETSHVWIYVDTALHAASSELVLLSLFECECQTQ
jgi:hypothetical protein